MRIRIDTPIWAGRTISLVWLLTISATVAACADAQERNHQTAGAANAPSPSATSTTQMPPNLFRPELDGRRLRKGALAPLRTTLATGQSGYTGSVSVKGPQVNGQGEGLVVTAAFSGDRGDAFVPCPAPWESIIRWGDGVHSTALWTSKVAPGDPEPTSHGFVVPPGPCRPRGIGPADTAEWYVNSKGRIGELRAIAGEPPGGVRADAPWSEPDGAVTSFSSLFSGKTLLADRDSERIWVVDRPQTVPGVSRQMMNQTVGILAQDETGRRWVETDSRPLVQNTILSWSDDRGLTWKQHRAPGSPVYTDRTIGFLDDEVDDPRSVTVSTDRGITWVRHALPDVRAIASLPADTHPAGWVETWLATRSGVLIVIFSYDPLRPDARPSVMVRSRDATWSTFQRVGTIPHVSSWTWTVKDDTLSGCDKTASVSMVSAPVRCVYSRDLGKSWHQLGLPK